jgi:hypothetical protein
MVDSRSPFQKECSLSQKLSINYMCFRFFLLILLFRLKEACPSGHCLGRGKGPVGRGRGIKEGETGVRYRGWGVV